MEQQQKPRMTDVMAAYQVLGALINSSAGQAGRIHTFTMRDNHVSYGNGCEEVGIVVTTRSFMDERRDAVEAKKHPLKVGAKVRVISLAAGERHDWDRDGAKVGHEGVVLRIDLCEPSEMCWAVQLGASQKDWFYFAASELEVIEPAPET